MEDALLLNGKGARGRGEGGEGEGGLEPGCKGYGSTTRGGKR